METKQLKEDRIFHISSLLMIVFSFVMPILTMLGKLMILLFPIARAMCNQQARRKTWNMLMHILLVTRMAEEERYFANPLMINKRKTTTFDSLVNKSRSKIGSCKAPLLSRLVRMCLICRLLLLYQSMIGVFKGRAKGCSSPAHTRVGRVELGLGQAFQARPFSQLGQLSWAISFHYFSIFSIFFLSKFIINQG